MQIICGVKILKQASHRPCMLVYKLGSVIVSRREAQLVFKWCKDNLQLNLLKLK